MNFKIGQDIDLTGKFVFLDVETANRNQDVCEIAAIVVNDRKIENIISTYVKPYERFEGYNIMVHGITPDRVVNYNSFDVIWKDYFSKYLEEYIFVAHNASFDLSAIRKSLQILGVNLPEINYICTQCLAKSMGLAYENREDLCKYFSLCIEKNHSALSDTEDCLSIYLKLKELMNFNFKSALKVHYNEKYVRTELPEEADKFFKWEMNRFSSKKVNCLSCYEELDLDFKGKTVLITGNFERYEKRDMLASEIHKRGATVVKGFTKNISMLIAGRDAGPKKLETAKQLGVKIVNEETLYEMLEDNSAID